jgi:hypothetical protein
MTYSIVGMEPAAADAAGTFPGYGHDFPSSPSLHPYFFCVLDYSAGGLLFDSRPGSILKSAEDALLTLDFNTAGGDRLGGEGDVVILYIGIRRPKGSQWLKKGSGLTVAYDV